MPNKKKSTRKRPEDNRPERVPLHEQKNLMTTRDVRPGYVERWVNDSTQRIAAMELAGWNIKENAGQVGDIGAVNQNQSLGTDARKDTGEDKRHGKPTYAILMETPKKLYEADQKAKQDKQDTIMNDMGTQLDKGEPAFSK